MDKDLRDLLGQLGHVLVNFAEGGQSANAPAVTDSAGADHYSQGARDARQYPVLSLFAPLNPDSKEVLPWNGPGGVKSIALKNGYTGSGLGGFFSPGGLLKWVKKDETVSITEEGRKRFKEIEERMSALA